MFDNTIDLCNLGEVRRLLDSFGLSPKKGYGQNFLVNSAIPAKIADTCFGEATGEDRAVLEIGPGIGAMTRELGKRFSSVVAVEIDRGLIPLLENTLEGATNITIVNEDFMKLDLKSFMDEHFQNKKISVCANLPYYITTPILMKLLEDVSPCPFENITVMVQTEVADRMCAAAGTSDYGAVTASIAYYGEAKKAFAVSAGNFYPAPKVTSSVVKIDIYKEVKYPALDTALVFDVIKAAFAQRRKTLANALNSAFPHLSKPQLESIITSLSHRPDIRGEKLDIAAFRDIADAIKSEKGR